MTSIDYIQEQFKKFEENINNKAGIEYLQSALEEIKMVSAESKDIRELTLVNNLFYKYRKIVMERARKVMSNGTPSYDELWLIVEFMHIFKENSLDEDTYFRDVSGKIVVLWLEAYRRENYGDKLDDSLKNEIYGAVTKDFYLANRER